MEVVAEDIGNISERFTSAAAAGRKNDRKFFYMKIHNGN